MASEVPAPHPPDAAGSAQGASGAGEDHVGDRVVALQQLLQHLGTLSQHAHGSGGALEAFLDQQNKQQASQDKHHNDDDVRLERLVKRAEACAAQLKGKDDEFQSVLREALGTVGFFVAGFGVLLRLNYFCGIKRTNERTNPCCMFFPCDA